MMKTRQIRHFRLALTSLEECVADMNRQNLAFTIQIGVL